MKTFLVDSITTLALKYDAKGRRASDILSQEARITAGYFRSLRESVRRLPQNVSYDEIQAFIKVQQQAVPIGNQMTFSIRMGLIGLALDMMCEDVRQFEHRMSQRFARLTD